MIWIKAACTLAFMFYDGTDLVPCPLICRSA
jgi:hypothetical protein